MMLVMLAVAWPVTRVCDYHDAIGMRETLARVIIGRIFTSRARIPYSSRARWWKCSRAV